MLGLVIDHLWQSTLVLVLCAAVAYVLRRRAARWRYLVWFAASMKFLVPFAALTALGAQFAWREAPSGVGDNEWHALAKQVFAPITAFELLEDWTWSGAVEQRRMAGSAQLTARAQQLLGQTGSAETSSISSGQSSVGTEISRSPNGSLSIPSIVLGVWLLGTCVVLVRWTRRWLQLRALARQATRLEVFGLPAGTPELRSCPSIMEPGIFGIFRPVLLIPAGIVERLSAQQLAAIIWHERVHIERRDNLTASLHMLVEAAFWFHPLVWWIGARLVDERERACDEAVLARGVDPDHYASGLIAICDFYVGSPLLCAAGVGGASLESRVKRIADNETPALLGRFARGLLVAIPPALVLAPLAIGLLSTGPVAAQGGGRQVLAPNGLAPALREYSPVDALATNDMSSIAILPDGTQLALAPINQNIPQGWEYLRGNGPDRLPNGGCPSGVDDAIANSGVRNMTVRCNRPFGVFGGLGQIFPATAYRGKRVRLRGELKANISDVYVSGAFAQDGAGNARGIGGLWVRVMGASPVEPLVDDGMDDRPIKGIVEWTPAEVVVDVPETAVAIWIGFWMQGRGQIWASRLEFEEVGLNVPVTALPKPLSRPRNLALE